jgi:hypothetical protein
VWAHTREVLVDNVVHVVKVRVEVDARVRLLDLVLAVFV